MGPTLLAGAKRLTARHHKLQGVHGEASAMADMQTPMNKPHIAHSQRADRNSGERVGGACLHTTRAVAPHTSA